MSLRDRFERLRDAASAETKATPYVAVHATQLAEVPTELEKGLGGLLMLQPIRTTGASLALVSYWASQAQFDQAAVVYGARLGTPRPSLGGSAEPLLPARKEWFPRWSAKLSTVVLSVAAFFGALEVIVNRYDRVFAAPQFSVRLDAPAYNLDEGQPFQVTATVENLMPVAELSNVRIAPTLPHPNGTSTTVTPADPPGTSLPATKQRAYILKGEAPPPGEYRLNVRVSGAAGWVREDRSEDTASQLVVWPHAPTVNLKLKTAAPDAADMSLAVRVGNAAGGAVECDLILPVGGLVFKPEYWRPADNAARVDWVAGPAPDGIARLRMHWPSVKSRSILRAEFTVRTTGTTDWAHVIQHSLGSCSIEKERSNAST